MEESHLVSAVNSLGTVITKSRQSPVSVRSNASDGLVSLAYKACKYAKIILAQNQGSCD
jgi:hypothetical protein